VARHLLTRWPEIAPLVGRARLVWLFLDFDGTLAPMTSRPEEATLGGATRLAIERLVRRPRTRITLVSGRRRADVIARTRVRHVQYWGLFGWEQDRRCTTPDSDRRALAHARQRLAALLGGLRGVRLEDKTWALAVHLRHATSAVRQRARAALRLCVARTRAGLHVVAGAHTLNVLPRAIRGKGDAVGRALRQLGSTTLPIYVGDDATDEPAFAAVRQGVAVRVGAPRRTSAGYYLSDTDEVRRFLERLDEDLRPRAPTVFNQPRPETRPARPSSIRRPSR
jgi:alpha,alpha-trehalase